MNRDQVAQQIMRLLVAYDPDRFDKQDIRDIWTYMDEVCAKIAYKEYREAQGLDSTSGVVGKFVRTFRDMPVWWDGGRKECYLQLPRSYVSLPNDAGIDRIATMDGKTVFVPVGRNFDFLFGNSHAKGLGGLVGYYVENYTIYFSQNVIKGSVDNLLVRCVASDSATLKPDEVYPCPQEYLQDIILQVYQLFVGNNQNEAMEATKL
jgi:hypothetical protein